MYHKSGKIQAYIERAIASKCWKIEGYIRDMDLPRHLAWAQREVEKLHIFKKQKERDPSESLLN